VQVIKLSFVIEFGYGMWSFLLVTLATLPTIVVTILPITVALAFFSQYSFLYFDRELTALSASGLSNYNIASPAIKLALFVTLICYIFFFLFGSCILPFLKNKLSNFRNHYISNVILENSFNKISKNITLYIDNQNKRNEMEGVILFDQRNEKEPSIIFANKGNLIIENELPTFILYNGMRQIIDKRGNMSQMSFDQFSMSLPQGVTERTLKSMDLQEYTFMQLLESNPELPEKRQRQIHNEKHQRILWPAYIMAYSLITLGVFFRMPHKRPVEKKYIINLVAILVLITYMHFALFNMAIKHYIYLALCYLNLLGGMIYGYILLKD
jgi:lipopolysaccharide export system permease protein